MAFRRWRSPKKWVFVDATPQIQLDGPVQARTDLDLIAMKGYHLLRGLLLLLIGSSADAATFSVGSDPACTHSTIAAAITAAASNAFSDEIILARPSFDDVELVVDGDQIALRGGFPACDAPAATGRTVLRGRDDPASRVLTLRNQGSGQPIVVSDVNIVRSGGALGGGIAMAGAQPVELRLVRTTVSGHQTIRGAGIDMEGPLAGPKQLTLLDSEVSANLAESGGGIYCNPGSVELGIGSRLEDNHAQYGGAVAGKFCQVRLIGDSSTSMRANTAGVHGGGVYLAGNGSFSALRKFGATSGPIVADNVAGGSGGAVYLTPGQGAGFTDTVVRGNRAGDSGGVVYGISSEAAFGREPAPCPLLDCGVIEGNRAGVNPVTEGRGGIVALLGNSGFYGFNRQYIVDNSARRGSLLWYEGGFIAGTVDSLIARNSGASELFWLESGSELRIGGSTLADNRDLIGIAGDRTEAVWIDGSILADSIPLIAPGLPLATTTTATCSILDPTTPPLTQETGVARVEDPGFVAAPLGDYSLRDDSAAIDFCAGPAFAGPIDLPGLQRGVVYRSNPTVRFDVGAFERNPLFADSFEN